MNHRQTKPKGITIMPEYIQSEGVQFILDRLEKLGINQIATSPYMMIPTPDGVGFREPPIDAGSGKKRLLDRPLWGKRELWFKVQPSFHPNLTHYKGLSYQPPAFVSEERDVLPDFIEAASERGIEVYFQIMAAIPPALRVQDGGPHSSDAQLTPDGQGLNNPLSNNGSLASKGILDYTCALVKDLIEQYPKLTGIRFDWPEYPCYHLDTIFTDFNPQVEAFANTHNFEFNKLKSHAAELYQKLQNLSNDDLAFDSLFELTEKLDEIQKWLKLKSSLVSTYNTSLCQTTQAYGKKAILHAFPPPFSDITGFDYTENNLIADGIGMKLYTMHLPMILHNYGTQLMTWNPNLNEDMLVSALNRWLNLSDKPLANLASYRYPTPTEAHQISIPAQTEKIQEACSKSSKVHIMSHTYGPTQDVLSRLDCALNHSQDGIWLNRYAYIDDEKYLGIQNQLKPLESTLV